VATLALIGLLLVAVAALTALGTGRDALRRRRHARLAQALARAFTDVALAPDARHARARFGPLQVALTLGPDVLMGAVALQDSVLAWSEIVERFGSDALHHELARVGATWEAAGTLRVAVPWQASRGDTAAALAERLAVAFEVEALRRHVPAEIAARIPRLRSAHEVDALVDALRRCFPDLPAEHAAFAAVRAREGAARVR